jgi:hypothetical protein
MNQIDVYYRALLNYRAQTAENRECDLLNKAIAGAEASAERVTVKRMICTVEEDWIEAIEQGLVHIENAIKEERQFIYSNGEVVPIEKVKHVSKETVQHLAKHSEMITKEYEGEDLIPDKLYSVERLNDYTVYENRFLYMLLCYLRDFVTIRYNKILDLSNRYEGMLRVEKEITLPKQTITYHVDLHDVRKDDPYLREHNGVKTVIDRIDLILKAIMAFLATPLMEMAAKVAMLKPPITKTNVLKMDNHFKGAVALYDYIIAYDKDGYKAEPEEVVLSPFGGNLAGEMADATSLLAFLTYEHGLHIGADLKLRYEREEQRRREEKVKQKAEQLEKLKRKVAKGEETPEEYMLALEKHVKLLQTENARMEPLRKELAETKEREEALKGTVRDMQKDIDSLHETLNGIEEKHHAAMQEVKTACNERIHQTLVRCEEEKHVLEMAYSERIEALNGELRATNERWHADVAAARADLEKERESYETLAQQHQQLAEEKQLCEAKLTAVMIENGLMTEDEELTDKESFDRLEKEFSAFLRFYEKQWGKTKKRIRKELLNYEYLKGQSGRNE